MAPVGQAATTQFALKARIKIERLGVGSDLGSNDHGAEEDEAAEARMNHVAMDAHVPEAGGHRDRLMRNDPKLARLPAIGRHRKTGGAAIDGADAGGHASGYSPGSSGRRS